MCTHSASTYTTQVNQYNCSRTHNKNQSAVATNQSQVGPEEGFVRQAWLLTGVRWAEKGVLLGRNISFFWWKLQEIGVEKGFVGKKERQRKWESGRG